jgi:hypothetical protein
LNVIGRLLDWSGGWLPLLVATVSSVLKTRAALQLENIALRHQIGVLQRSAKKRLSSVRPIASCGFGFPGFGRIGVRRWSS